MDTYHMELCEDAKNLPKTKSLWQSISKSSGEAQVSYNHNKS